MTVLRLASLAANVLLSLALGLALVPFARALAAPIKLVAFGDSLSAGYGLPTADGFPARLEAALKARGLDVTVVNASVSGDTTAGGVDRVDWALGDKPDAAIVELGANDGLRGLDPKAAEANLDAILDRFQAAHVRVLLAGMRAPPNYGPSYTAAFDPIFARLAERHHVLLYPFFLDGVAADPALNQADGIHPNARGVEIIVARIVPFVTKLIEAPS